MMNLPKCMSALTSKFVGDDPNAYAGPAEEHAPGVSVALAPSAARCLDGARHPRGTLIVLVDAEVLYLE